MTANDRSRQWSERKQSKRKRKQEPILVKLLYMLTLSFGWGYLGEEFNWPVSARLVAFVMTLVFAFYVSRVIEDDRR